MNRAPNIFPVIDLTVENPNPSNIYVQTANPCNFTIQSVNTINHNANFFAGNSSRITSAFFEPRNDIILSNSNSNDNFNKQTPTQETRPFEHIDFLNVDRCTEIEDKIVISDSESETSELDFTEIILDENNQKPSILKPKVTIVKPNNSIFKPNNAIQKPRPILPKPKITVNTLPELVKLTNTSNNATKDMRIEDCNGQKFIIINNQRYLIQQIVDSLSGRTLSTKTLDNAQIQKVTFNNQLNAYNKQVNANNQMNLNNVQKLNYAKKHLNIVNNTHNQLNLNVHQLNVTNKQLNAPNTIQLNSNIRPQLNIVTNQNMPNKQLNVSNKVLGVPKKTAKTKKGAVTPKNNVNMSKTNSRTICYSCGECGKSFAHSVYLNKHMRIHKTQCAMCSEVLASHELLLKHIQYHNSARFVCMHCNKDFSRQSVLDTHLKTCGNAPLTLFKCDSCQISFSKEERLTNHMFEKHFHNYC